MVLKQMTDEKETSFETEAPDGEVYHTETGLDELPYFILHGKDSHGPYTIEEIHAQLAEGAVTPASYAWNQTMTEWLPLSQVMNIDDAVLLQATAIPVHHLAGLGRRFVAGLLDLLFIVIAFEAAIFLVPEFRGLVEAASGDSAQLLELNLMLSGMVYLYYMLMLARPGRGATLGYRIMRLRLVDQARGTQPGWTHCLLWCIGSVVLPIGWVIYWFDARRRMLHNVISQTVVIDLRVSHPT